MSLTATNAQVYKGTAAVTYGSGSGVSGSQLQGSATITYGGAPTSNTALSLPGTSGNYMLLPASHPTNFDPSTSNVFVEAWVYWNGANWTATSGGGIYERENVGNTVQDFGMYTDNTGKLTSYMYTQNGSILRAAYNTSTLNVQQWYHVAFAYNTVNQTSYVWVNGNIGTPSTASNPARYTVTQTYIGFNPINMPSVYAWNGYINDMRVIKGGIVPTTSFTPVTAPFRLGQPPYVTGGSTVLSLYEQYFYPSWLNLPGANGAYMDFSSVPVTRVNTSTTNMFLETWCYFNSLTGVEQYIAGILTISSQSIDDWGLRWDSTANKIQVYHYNSANGLGTTFSSATPNAGQWYHVAMSVVTGNPGYIYLFVNGVLQNSGGTSVGGIPRYTPSSTFWIGSPGNTGWGPSNVRIQDLRIVSGGTVPTATFTPGSAPFGLASPGYISNMGTTVLSLATQYYQTSMTIQNNLSPFVYLAPTGSYPSFNSTGGTAPTFLSDRVRFNPGSVSETSSACQFIDFGAQTFLTTSKGFSSAVKFQFTGTPGSFERIFCINPENSNPTMSFKRNTNTNILLYGYYNPSQSYGADFGSYAQNTTYTVICIYDPTVGTYGTLYIYKNGTLDTTYTVTSAKLADFTSTNMYIGSGRTYSGDGALNADIFYAAFYNRVLSASEIASVSASGPSFGPVPMQMTNRPIQVAVLSVGNTNLTGGGTIVVSQTALQPANGIVWTFRPTGSGVTLVSTTDYALTLTVATTVSPVLCTVTAKNKNGYTAVIQFVASSLPSGTVFGLFASPTLTGTWNGLSYTIYTPQNSGTYPPLTLYGTSAANSTVWDSGGVYSPGTGLPSNGASFNAFLPGTSTYGDYTMVQFSAGVVFASVYIGLNGANYNPIGSIAVWGSNTGTAPWTQLFSGSSGLTSSNYNTGTAAFVKFTFSTTGSFTNYACQISTVLPGFGNNPSTGCLYWST